MLEPRWLLLARKYIGVREIKGPRHEQQIVKWWEAIGAPFRDDETAWCGAMVGGVLSEAGLPIVSGGAAARNWLKLPVKLDRPAVGCVVVFWRGTRDGALGHVGFVVGQDRFGNLMVLGGNQGDEVCIKPFSRDRVLGYRWPSTWPLEERFNLPVLASDGRVSTNEA
ncbi:MAG TPA: TIGR02594 family protein [Xanthobacteraceae bacterium]|nr:TIGR02594 family protein [Xanthobacteraceae bacterium]